MILILGGGLAGLSTAYHLSRDCPSVERRVLEREPQPGGLCRSDTIGEFVFDYTGHYLHLRDPEIVTWVERLLGDELVEVERESRIHCRGTLLHFPFQANLHGLPADVVARCLVDFARASQGPAPDAGGQLPFGRWARLVFGDAIAEEFIIPFNAKQFGVDADEITAEWVAWAVPRPSLEQVVRGALGLRNVGLGYNPKFRYPRRGGIGRLAQRLAEHVAADLELGASAVEIDAARRTVTLASGESRRYDRLVSTVPLPRLLLMTRGLDHSGQRSLAEIAGRLRWSAVHELRLGVDRPRIASGVHWIYFPEPDYPFYRVGFPSNVCPALAPAGCSSISVEFRHPPGRPLPGLTETIGRAREGLERAGLLDPATAIVASDQIVIDPAYVLFDRLRTPLTEEAQRRLAEAGILSVGRFGAWTYSYMERALLDGQEAARAVAAWVDA